LNTVDLILSQIVHLTHWLDF